jgi:elongation factor Ts
LVKDIAMQIAAAKPEFVKREDVPSEALEHEKSILRAQALNEGKPANIVEKMVEGRVDKYFKEVCLMEQPFIKNPDMSVKQLLTEKISKIGENISIRRFTRYELGEGIEKKQSDLAAEVAEATRNVSK